MKKSISTILISVLIAGNVMSQNGEEFMIKYYHQPIVKMTLNGKKMWVLLDTGSGITVLNSKSKKSFKFNTILRTGDQYSVSGFGSDKNQLQNVSQAKLVFGDTHLKQAMYAFDITNISESIFNKTGKRITAIAGTNLMKKYGFTIDLGSGTVKMSGKKKNKRDFKNDGMLLSSN